MAELAIGHSDQSEHLNIPYSFLIHKAFSIFFDAATQDIGNNHLYVVSCAFPYQPKDKTDLAVAADATYPPIIILFYRLQHLTVYMAINTDALSCKSLNSYYLT